MTDFNLPALPCPEQQGIEGQRELPRTVVGLLGIDQKRQRFTAGVGVGFAPHDHEPERTMGGPSTDEHTAHFDLEMTIAPAHLKRAFLPTAPLLPDLLGRGSPLTVQALTSELVERGRRGQLVQHTVFGTAGQHRDAWR